MPDLQFTLFPPEDEPATAPSSPQARANRTTTPSSRPEARAASRSGETPVFPLQDSPAGVEGGFSPLATRKHIAASAPEGAPPDHHARERALNPQLSCIVEAPAGSGKTGLLLQRFLKLLATVEQPEEVLAITFTRKATAELRERVLEHLHAAAHPLPPEAGNFLRQTHTFSQSVLAADAQFGWGLLDQPNRLRIQTIDSLCGEIARTLPLLSGSGTTQPVEDAFPIYRDAARRTLLELGGSDAALNEALRTVLLHRDGNLADCENLIARMLSDRQQWGELVPLRDDTLTDHYLDTEVRPRLERSLESIVSAGLRRAFDAMPAGALAELTALAGRLALSPSYNGCPSPIAICANRHQPPGTRAQDRDHWTALIHLLLKGDDHWRVGFNKNHLGFELSRQEQGELRSFIQGIGSESLREALCAVRTLPPARYPDDQWRVAKALFRLLRRALAELKLLFAERGECDFPELALAAAEALSNSGLIDLAASPTAKLTHLLVDEMQDTSSSQYKLLELLTRSWDGHSQTLFLVGDPKQSVYLFRQARVERFLRTMHDRRLGEVPLEPLQLTANFRSQGALVEAFNDTFSHIFSAAPATGEQMDVPFVHAGAVRPPAAESPSIHWHTEVLGDDAPAGIALVSTELKAAHQRAEARSIRRIIERWRARPLPAGRTKPWRIAVLARARSHFAAIAAELSGATGAPPIPYRAIKIDALNERPEVLDLLALTRALLHPADRSAWLAVLRAPWCGLSLTDLLRLTGEGPGSDPKASVPELVATRSIHLSPDGQQLLARTWPILSQALNTFGRTPLTTDVERTWRSLGGDAPLTPERLTNARSFLRVLHELERTGGRVDLALLSRRLADLHAEPIADDDAVELLTIHNSKGLEFDLVLVPSLERQSDRSHSHLLNWLELDARDEAAAHILLAPIWPRGNDRDPLNDWLSGVRTQRERAEIRRLFYVACTRAQEELHLFAACERKNDGSIRSPLPDTLLAAAWPLISPAFINAQPQPSAPRAANNVYPFPTAHAENTSHSGLALAAAAESNAPTSTVLRLPRDFDPLARFHRSQDEILPYTPASSLAHAPTFDRPEGSFAVRAFGNVVHRFLQILSQHLDCTSNADALLAELPSWLPRLVTALRGEGLSSSAAQQNAPRALTALQNSLTDPVGRWILSPHRGAANERSFVTPALTLRADRIFLAGPTPRAAGDTHLWIVDFKTTEQGSRTRDLFEQGELLKYRAQLERYASVQRRTFDAIQLALYYPLVPHIIHWSAFTANAD